MSDVARREPGAPPHPLIRSVKPVVDAVGASFVPVEEMEASDVPLRWEGVVVGAVRMPPLHGALDRLIDAVEAELGGTVSNEHTRFRKFPVIEQTAESLSRREFAFLMLPFDALVSTPFHRG